MENNKSGKIETLDHLIDYEEKKLSKTYDFILDLDVSSPLRNLDDLVNGFNILNNDKSSKIKIYAIGFTSLRNSYLYLNEQDKSRVIISDYKNSNYININEGYSFLEVKKVNNTTEINSFTHYQSSQGIEVK